MNQAALGAAIEVMAIAKHSHHTGFNGALETGEHTATVVEVPGLEVHVTGLADDIAALVVEIAIDLDTQAVLPLQLALRVRQAKGVDAQVAVLAVDQTVSVVLNDGAGIDGQRTFGRDGAALAVVQAAHGQ